MASVKPVSGAYVSSESPNIRGINPADLREALAKGLKDFAAMPTHSIFLVILYPVVGLILLRLTFGYDILPLIFPLVAGFALIGPLAAIGLYEMSRRRELNLRISWEALSIFHLPRIGAIATVGVVLMLIFLAWLGAAMAVYRRAFGDWVPPSIPDFAAQVFTTSPGWTLIVAGCGIGFLFAVAAFAISVVSVPLLLDRDVTAGVAILTSIRAVLANPATMMLWGLIVTCALILGSLPLLIGLAVVLPVLGHSTWHLYRKIVE